MTMIGLKIAMDGAVATQKRLNHVQGSMHRSIQKNTLQEAHLLRLMIVKGIRSQAPGGKRFKPLEDSTIARRKPRSTKALIDQGDLIRSILVHKEFGGQVAFVGVHKEAVNEESGESQANIAEVHEFGTKDKRVPARPYLRPSFNVWKKDVNKRLLIRIVSDTKLGKPFVKGAQKILTDSTKKGITGNIKTKFTKAGKMTWKIS